MRNTRVISISLPEAQAKSAEQLAKAENRTMSELVREALRRYQQEKRDELIATYRKKAEVRGIKEEDVVRIIREERRKRTNKQSST